MARKVNKKFVMILVAGVVCVAGVAAGGWYWHHRKHDARHMLMAGDNFAAQNDFLHAAPYYYTAAAGMHDPKIWVEAGDAYAKLIYTDEQNAKNVIAAYDAALGIDPAYLPALQHKLAYFQDGMKYLPAYHTPAIYDIVRDLSQKILKADPANKVAAIAIPVSVIEGLQHNLETDPTKVNDAILQLQKQQNLDPTNADIPYYMAAGYEGLARRATRDSKPADADKFNAQALAVIDPAVKSQDASAAFHYRAAQIYIGQIQLGTPPDKSTQSKDRAVSEITRAGDLVKPADPMFVEIKLYQGFLAELFVNRLAAAKIYRDAITSQPQELRLRLKLADIIGDLVASRDEAIDLLKNAPPPSVEQQTGARGSLQHSLEIEQLCSLTNIRLDKYFTLKSDSEKQVFLGEVEQDYRKIEVTKNINLNEPSILRIKAKLQLARNQPGDAIATLDRAIGQIDSRNPMLYELMFLEARACLQTNQEGTAKKNLLQIVTHYPDYDQARILLAQTQLKEFDFDAAKDNLKVLMEPKHQPNNPEVVRMQIAVLQQEKKPDDVKALYTKLPEDSRGQKLDKATIATLVGLGDDAKRLMQAVLVADPGDVDAAMMLSQFDQRNKDSAGAVAVLDAALKVKPTNSDLLLQRARLTGSSPSDIRKIQMQEATNIADPLERELRLFDLTRNEKDEKIPLAHLDAAEQANPNDLRVMNVRFDYFLAIHDWDKAGAYAGKLGKVNADKVQGTLYLWRIAMAQTEIETDKDKHNADLGRARDLANKLTHDFPVYAQSWVCMGQTLQSLGQFQQALGQSQQSQQQFQDAIQAFTEAKQRQPENVEPYLGMIDCYYQLKRPADARKVIDEAVDRLPTYPNFKELQMQNEMNFGNPEKVIAAREKIVADSPDLSQNWKALAVAYESVAQLKANTPGKEAEENPWLEKAKNTLAQAAAKFPDDLSFVAMHGAVCLRLKQADQGEKLWQTALARPEVKDKPQVLEAFSEYYVRAAKLPEAEKVLRDFLATPAGKDNAEVVMSLSTLLVGQNKFDAAIAALDMVPGDPHLQVRKSDILITQGKYADAEKIINNLMQGGKTPELMCSLAFVYLNSNRAQQALDLLNQVLTTSPGYVTAIYYRAMATAATGGKIASVISDLNAVRTQTPANMNARYLLITNQIRAGRTDAAIKELEAILHDDPGQKQARIQLLSLYSQPPTPQWLDAERIVRDTDANPDLANDLDILNAEAQMWSARGMSVQATASIQRALKVQPQNLGLMQTYYNILLKAEQYQQVLDATDKLPDASKDQPWVHSLRGMAKSKMGDKDGATTEFVAALSACSKAKDDDGAQRVISQVVDSAGVDAALTLIKGLPQASEPRWQMTTAELFYKQHKIPEARKATEPVLAGIAKLTIPQQQEILGFAGSLYMQTPDADNAKARDIFLQLLRLRPDDYRVYNNLACNLTVSAADSLEYSQKAYELMQKTESYEPLVADTYGWNLVQNSDTGLDQGIIVLQDAWKSKEIVDIAYHLGAAFLKKGNPDEAIRYLTKAQSMFSDALNANTVTDMTLQQKIIDALRQANDKKAKPGS